METKNSVQFPVVHKIPPDRLNKGLDYLNSCWDVLRTLAFKDIIKVVERICGNHEKLPIPFRKGEHPYLNDFKFAEIFKTKNDSDWDQPFLPTLPTLFFFVIGDWAFGSTKNYPILTFQQRDGNVSEAENIIKSEIDSNYVFVSRPYNIGFDGEKWDFKLYTKKRSEQKAGQNDHAIGKVYFHRIMRIMKTTAGVCASSSMNRTQFIKKIRLFDGWEFTEEQKLNNNNDENTFQPPEYSTFNLRKFLELHQIYYRGLIFNAQDFLDICRHYFSLFIDHCGHKNILNELQTNIKQLNLVQSNQKKQQRTFAKYRKSLEKNLQKEENPPPRFKDSQKKKNFKKQKTRNENKKEECIDEEEDRNYGYADESFGSHNYDWNRGGGFHLAPNNGSDRDSFDSDLSQSQNFMEGATYYTDQSYDSSQYSCNTSQNSYPYNNFTDPNSQNPSFIINNNNNNNNMMNYRNPNQFRQGPPVGNVPMNHFEMNYDKSESIHQFDKLKQILINSRNYLISGASQKVKDVKTFAPGLKNNSTNETIKEMSKEEKDEIEKALRNFSQVNLKEFIKITSIMNQNRKIENFPLFLEDCMKIYQNLNVEKYSTFVTIMNDTVALFQKQLVKQN